jgi:hypothetical protein
MMTLPRNRLQPKEWYAAYRFEGPRGRERRRMVVMAYIRARDPGAAWRTAKIHYAGRPLGKRPDAVCRAKHVPADAKGRREL